MERRVCKQCGKEKDLCDFALTPSGNGYLNMCEQCKNKIINEKEEISVLSPHRELTEEEKAALEKMEKQKQVWGTLPIWSGVIMNAEIYDELDRQYKIRCEEYKSVGLSLSQEETLREVVRLKVAASYLRSQGDDTFAKALKSADDLLASEQMRKKDEKPTENYRIDSHIVAMEKAGLIKDGKFMKYEQTAKAIAKNLPTKRKYDYSIDAADDILLDILNTMRTNSDKPLLEELPKNLQVQDSNGEFSERTEAEDERRAYAGIVKETRS